MSERDEDKQLRQDVLDALATVQDPGMRVVLMLLHRGLEAINSKLDRVLSDETKIKQIVLNGGAETHHDEHVWQRSFQKEWATVSPAIDKVCDLHKDGYCAYAKRMQKQEEEDANSKRKIRDEITSKLLWGIILLIAGALAQKYFIG